MWLLSWGRGKKPDCDTLRLDILVSALKMEDKRQRDLSKGDKPDICHLHECAPPVGPALIEALFQPARQPCCLASTFRELSRKLCVQTFQVVCCLRALTPIDAAGPYPTRAQQAKGVPTTKSKGMKRWEKTVICPDPGKIRHCSKCLRDISHWPTKRKSALYQCSPTPASGSFDKNCPLAAVFCPGWHS